MSQENDRVLNSEEGQKENQKITRIAPDFWKLKGQIEKNEEEKQLHILN